VLLAAEEDMIKYLKDFETFDPYNQGIPLFRPEDVKRI